MYRGNSAMQRKEGKILSKCVWFVPAALRRLTFSSIVTRISCLGFERIHQGDRERALARPLFHPGK